MAFFNACLSTGVIVLNRWSLLLALALSLALALPAAAVEPAPTLAWATALGGVDGDAATSVSLTTDGGYIVTGETNSNHTGDVGFNHGIMDALVIKLDGAGQKVWNTTLGGDNYDGGLAIRQTTDGGYIVAGATYSNQTGDVGFNHGLTDAWVFKLDGAGQIAWSTVLGGNDSEGFTAIEQTSDGGYIAAGTTNSNRSDDVGVNHGDNDFWVVRLDGTGQKVWNTTLGGDGSDEANAVWQTSDGGYIVAGETESNQTGDVGFNHGSVDYWVVKLDDAGQKVWNTTLGGNKAEEEATVGRQTSDGGYVVAGKTYSNQSDDVGFNHGEVDCWVVKLDGSGRKVWNATLGGAGDDDANAVQQTMDGGYIVAGKTESDRTGDVGSNHGLTDFWVVRLDGAGQKVWNTTLGGTGIEEALSIQQTTGGGIVVAGYTTSNGTGDVGFTHGNFDYWVCRLGAGSPVPTPVIPAGSFAAYPESGTAPLAVQFLDYTADARAWRWDFGDGGLSDLQYPVHVYNRSGLYTVSVTVTDWAGTTTTKTEYHLIRVTAPPTPAPTPVADFTANTTTGQAPLVVQFTDGSGKAPYHWWWEFGDGSSSTERDPVHTYERTGAYTVNLTVWTALGQATVSKPAYIIVDGDPRVPEANFTMSRTSGAAPLYVRFTDTSTGNPASWRWDFGGTAWTTTRNPAVIFRRPGTYPVTLTVRNAYGWSSMSTNVTVTGAATRPAKGDAISIVE
jgi:PKD repeat protein